MPRIEVQVRLPTAQGIWRWFEYLDESDNVSELLRRVVKYDVHEGSTVRSSQTLWLRTYELLVKVVAHFDTKAGCYRQVRADNLWYGCYDRNERTEALEEKWSFTHRSFLTYRREAKVGYTERDRAQAAIHRDRLQAILDNIVAEKAAIEAEDPRKVKLPLYPARKLAQIGVTHKCIVYCIHRGVITSTKGYPLPDLADLRKGSSDNLEKVMKIVQNNDDADALEAAIQECLAMGMDKSSVLAKEAFRLLKKASKVRDLRMDSLQELDRIVKFTKKKDCSLEFEQVKSILDNAQQIGVPSDHDLMVAVFEVLAELQAVEEARQKEQFQEQEDVDQLADYCSMNGFPEAIAGQIRKLGFTLETMHNLKQAHIKNFKGINFKSKKRFGALMKKLKRMRNQ